MITEIIINWGQVSQSCITVEIKKSKVVVIKSSSSNFMIFILISTYCNIKTK